jgi:hypothetical protein
LIGEVAHKVYISKMILGALVAKGYYIDLCMMAVMFKISSLTPFRSLSPVATIIFSLSDEADLTYIYCRKIFVSRASTSLIESGLW